MVWSFEPDTRIWPIGCQSRAKTEDSWAPSIPPTEWSVLLKGVGGEYFWDLSGSGEKCIFILFYPTSQNIIDPSDPPLQKRDSWNGCHATAITSG